MNRQEQQTVGSDLADQAMDRTIAPGTRLHDHLDERAHSGVSSYGEGDDRDHHDRDHDHEHEHEHEFEWPEALRIVAVALAAAVVWFRLWEPLSSVSVL